MSRKSILFVAPDYHCSFFYRDEFRKLGWKADIYVPPSYPEKLLYSDKGVLRAPALPRGGRFANYVNLLLLFAFYLGVCWRYRYHLYYGRFEHFYFGERYVRIDKVLGPSFSVASFLAKLFRRKIIYLPTGCHDIETRKNFSKLDEGNVCNNCGSADKCDDRLNTASFGRIRKYADLCVGFGEMESTQYRATHFKYKALDLSLWRPDLDVPEEYRLPATEKLRILHSFFCEGRNYEGKNIKGSPFILAAIERLRQEGHKVEYMYIRDVPSRLMRYYQVQADIVVEQLIYGWWGSTGVETMALGKPVVCYLRPAWKEFFLKVFPEHSELPIVEANTSNIYEVLRKLVTDQDYRVTMGRKSRQFAEQHFDARSNALAVSELLLRL